MHPERFVELAVLGVPYGRPHAIHVPYLNDAQVFFVYRYSRHHVEANPGIAQWYFEKAAHKTGSVPDAGRNPMVLTRSPSRSYRQGGSVKEIIRRTVHSVKTIDPKSD